MAKALTLTITVPVSKLHPSRAPPPWREVTFTETAERKHPSLFPSLCRARPFYHEEENIWFLILRDNGPLMPAFHMLRAYKNFWGMEVNNFRAECNKVIFIFFSFIMEQFGLRLQKPVLMTGGKGLIPLVKDNRVLLDHRDPFSYHRWGFWDALCRSWTRSWVND